MRLARKEHEAASEAMRQLTKKGKGGRNPLPEDNELYMRLATVKDTLEWAYPRLIKTTAKGHERLSELMGYKHYVMGPTFTLLHP
jgi:hypothetical protein